MFGKIGLPELILILVIALIIFGPRKLPEIGKSIGKGLREFKQATTEISKTVSFDDDDVIIEGDKETKENKESGNQNEVADETDQPELDSGEETAEEDKTSADQGESETIKNESVEEAKH